MSFLALNLLLAIVWMFLAGNFAIGGFVFGFLVGFLILVLSQAFIGSGQYVRAVTGSVRLLGVFLYELVVANLQLAKDVLSPTPPLKPGFVRYDVRDLTPGQTVLLGHMISLTPGTLTVDFDAERQAVYIHTVYAQDPAKLERGFRLFADLIIGAAGNRAEGSA